MTTSGREVSARAGAVCEILQHPLTNLITLSLLAKQAQWNVIGPSARSVSLQLEELAELARRAGDRVGERIATLGGSPDGRPESLAREVTMPTVAPERVGDREAVRLMAAALDVTINQLGVAIDMTTEADPVSRDLLVGAAAGFERQAWMLRAQLA
jgi:starvation-inducible DNA-binding protein